MKKKSFFLVLAIFSFLFFSCEEDENENKNKLYLGAVLTLEDANGLLHKQGIETAIEEINENGGILDGYFLEVDYRSSQPIEKENREEQSKLVAQKIIDEHKENLIGFISASSSGSRGIVSVAEKYNIPTISGFSTSKANTCLSPYFCRTAPSDLFMVEILAQKTIEYGITKVSIAIENKDLYSETLAEDFINAFKKRGGEIVTNISFDKYDVNYENKIKQLYQNSPQAIFCSMLTIYSEFFNNLNSYLNSVSDKEEDISYILGTKDENLLKQANYNFLLGTMDNFNPRVFGVETYPDRNSAAFQHLKEKFHEKYKQEVNGYVQCFYDIPFLYALAIERNKVNKVSVDNIEFFRQELNKQIRMIANPEGKKVGSQEGWSYLKEVVKSQNVNYEGVSGNCNFDECGDVKTMFDIFIIDKNENNEFFFKTIDSITLEEK